MKDLPLVGHDGSFPLWEKGAPEPDGVKAVSQPCLFPLVLKSGRPTGAVIVLPGGGYGGLAPHEDKPIAEWLNRGGISAFVLHYRVAPHKHPVPMLDAQRAVRLVRFYAAEWNIKSDHVGILGFSAGGHLASTAATHFDDGQAASDPVDHVSCRPDAAVLCYPVITFGEFRNHGSMVNLIGENPPEALRQSLSNELQVTPQTPPAFLWHTSDDAAVPLENSLLFAAALHRNQVPCELHVFPHGNHGLGLAEADPIVGAWSGLCITWLKGLGF